MKFSTTSLAKLQRVHPRLVQLLNEVTELFDCSVLGGIRTLADQKEDVALGLSETMKSKHLPQADGFAHAVDVAPTPLEFDTSGPARIDGRPITAYEVECIAFLFYTKGYAAARGLSVRIGADWNGNNRWQDNSFNDLDHVELLHDDEPTTPLPPLSTPARS